MPNSAHCNAWQGRRIGTKDPARVRGLVFEQKQLIPELKLIAEHLQQVETEMIQVVEHCREGKILTSLPGIGPQAAAALIATIGTSANFERAAQLKSYFGWVPRAGPIGLQLGLDPSVSSWGPPDETDAVSHRVESDSVGCRVETDV